MGSSPLARRKNKPGTATETGTSRQLPPSDEELVACCLAGRGDSWIELSQRHLEGLTDYIRQRLKGQGNAPCRAADLAEHVLESLFERTMDRLRRYEAAKLPFGPYLQVLAWQAIVQEHREIERRKRLQRELVVRRRPAEAQAVDPTAALIVAEFITSRSPRLRAFWHHDVCGEPDPSGRHKFTRKQAYAMIERILKKAQDLGKYERGMVGKL